MSSMDAKIIRVCSVALNQTPMAWEENSSNIVAALQEAQAKQVSLVCFPELCICGYNCEDAFLSYDLVQTSFEVLQEILPHTKGMVVALGLPLLHSKALFNCSALVADGEILGFVAKRSLAGDGIHYEPRWFKPWPAGLVNQITLNERTYPLGDLAFDLSGVRIGFEICEDAWAANRPGNELSERAVDFLLNPSASHFAFGKQAVRDRFVLDGSRAFGVCYVYCNMLGCEAGRAIYDGGALIASAGKLISRGRRFSFKPYEVYYADIDLADLRMQQAKSASFSPSLSAQDRNLVRSKFKFPEKSGVVEVPQSSSAWEDSDYLKHEEFSRAVSLGLFDYLRKSGSSGFVVSLSGGADSSAVSCLVYLMVHFAVHELGLPGLKNRLKYIPAVAQAHSEKDLVNCLLTCVYQATSNSSKQTLKSAKELSAALGAGFYHFKIDPLVESYSELVSDALSRELSWEQDDLALQNIQARVRGPGIWMLANVKRALLLSTSNRSEAAVGYATMDGDTCGGLSPIAGIDKAYLREWLVWLERTGPLGLTPITTLKLVNEQAPTAELRPASRKQTDEEDLMPYVILDYIEKLAIRDKKNPLEIYLSLRRDYPAKYDSAKLHEWVKKFFTLWSVNQWKRERYAPCFHLDDENLDPKTWCRFPILSGGYKRELQKLDDYCQGERKK